MSFHVDCRYAGIGNVLEGKACREVGAKTTPGGWIIRQAGLCALDNVLKVVDKPAALAPHRIGLLLKEAGDGHLDLESAGYGIAYWVGIPSLFGRLCQE
jgi:hypothetical protein